jgi:type II restriction enzyme
MDDAAVTHLINRWRDDPGGTYRTWFRWEERIKNFRSIRRGIQAVVEEIEGGTFGNAYRGSALETVVGSIAEQRQLFKGADHAFLWKPKLRIPDIYEDRTNQLAFGRFLDTCVCCSTEAQLLGAVHALDERRIKGLGPAAANLLYFLHPTILPPFNTAIVKGYNALTGAQVKLGRWPEYVAMRAGILRLNDRFRALLSNDLGAIAGLLFDLGSGRYPLPPVTDDAAARDVWLRDLATIREQATAARTREKEALGDRTHTEIQGWLRDLGHALGFAVWIASNDRKRAFDGGRLADGCLGELPAPLTGDGAAETVRLIDVLWLDARTGAAVAAFEVEHTTSIYSGIVRMLDLALGAPSSAGIKLYLVAPDAREADVRGQLARPAFRRIGALDLSFLPYSALETQRAAMMKFGQGLRPLEAVAMQLT